MKVNVNGRGKLSWSSKLLTDNRKVTKIHLKYIPEDVENIEITIEWNFPANDIAGRWHPRCKFDRSVKADWFCEEKSMIAVSAPVITFFSEDGKNRGTFAVSETQKEVKICCGVHEEDGEMLCRVIVKMDTAGENEYKVVLLQDYRDVRYEQAIREVGLWWERECGLTPAYVPDIAKDPIYSFWYSFHQKITDEEIEEECKRAKEMGFGTVIVDDGWQTDDTNRGYGYCGDWRVAEKKIKNMKQHVENVHNMGLRYMLWFSVPFVGKYSGKWEDFREKLIAVDEEQETGILDIRYPEVREYLKNIYVKAVKEWKLDGLKLDFIDEFYCREDTPKANEKMDCVCLEIALNKLLEETMSELKNINKEILIEFRQRYIGPTIRKYGNMLRVVDCPVSSIANRVGSLDLRLLSGATAVHCDPIMWHQCEKPEIAALQIINSLFSTLQFSVRIDCLDERQKNMVKNFLTFMKEHKILLQNSPVQAKEPQNLYPEVRVKDMNKEIVVLYSSGRVVTIDHAMEATIIVNGTKAKEIYIKTEEKSEVEISRIDCLGNLISLEKITFERLHEIKCDIADRIEIRKVLNS